MNASIFNTIEINRPTYALELTAESIVFINMGACQHPQSNKPSDTVTHGVMILFKPNDATKEKIHKLEMNTTFNGSKLIDLQDGGTPDVHTSSHVFQYIGRDLKDTKTHTQMLRFIVF